MLKYTFLGQGAETIKGSMALSQDPDGEIENSGKSIFKTRIPNFCYIHLLRSNRCHWQIANVKNYNLNEVRDSDFKNAFPGIFDFTIGILLSYIMVHLKVKSETIPVYSLSNDFSRSALNNCQLWVDHERTALISVEIRD